MLRPDAIRVEGRVIECRPPVAMRVELANGHQLWAFGPGRRRDLPALGRLGDMVTVELSPFDLSKGRWLPKNDGSQT